MDVENFYAYADWRLSMSYKRRVVESWHKNAGWDIRKEILSKVLQPAPAGPPRTMNRDFAADMRTIIREEVGKC